ncbi:MAG: carboxypeptidase regulatory-like domain-containing protein, partial [bacterium]|nr:carboxypeptidase regulatory-like domain-containing protein [bacterium]
MPGGTFKTTRSGGLAEGAASIRYDGDVVTLTLQFAGFGTLTGTVLDPNDQPVLGADVVLSARRLDTGWCSFVSDPRAKQVRTGLDGAFVFQNVPVGAITVSASSSFYQVPTAVQDILLADGDSRNFTLTLSEHLAGELSGTVYLPDGETPAGSGVSVTALSSVRPEVTVT